MKQFDWKSGMVGAAAERDPDDGRYQLSESIVLLGGTPTAYRMDTRTGEVMLLSHDKASFVKGTEISSR